MELSTDQLSEVLKCASPEGYRDVDHNLRRAVRVNILASISIATIIDGRRQAPVMMTVRDISVRGVGFLFDRALQAGQQLIVYLAGDTAKPLNMLCNVVHCRRTYDNNAYTIGAEFVCIVPPDARPGAHGKIEADRIRDTMFS